MTTDDAPDFSNPNSADYESLKSTLVMIALVLSGVINDLDRSEC